MLKTEVIEKVRKTCNTADSEVLENAIQRLEMKIAELLGKKYDESKKEITAEGFDDMYFAYLMAETYMLAEDWDCYEIYSKIYEKRYSEYVATVIRNSPGKAYDFKDWRCH